MSCLFLWSTPKTQDCTGILQEVNSSLIPNHSFEEFTICPDGISQMSYAVGWIQASNPTSDFLHNCGNNWDYFEFPDVPFPLPDGDGFVGILNLYPDWLEYVGACTTSDMLAGTEYTLRFHVGLGTGGLYPSPSSINLSVFGNPNCDAIPFNGYSCPLNADASWMELGQVNVTGSNEWIEVTIQFTPTTDLGAVVLGPSCQSSTDQGYTFLDGLVLIETTELSLTPEITLSGTPCSESLTLVANPTGTDYLYEWYKDGALIPGATDTILPLAPGEEGVYYVRLTTLDGSGCEESSVFELILPSLATNIDTTVCYGESIIVAGEELTVAGYYNFSAINDFGCDSSTTVNLSIQPPIELVEQVPQINCFGGTSTILIESISGSNLTITWDDGDVNFTRTLSAGTYNYEVTDDNGCSTTGTVVLTDPPLLDVLISAENVSCADGQDGMITVQTQGGNPPYEVTLIGYSTTSGPDVTFESLADGFYEVAVLDANGCQLSDTLSITMPAPLAIELTASPVSCNGENSGTAAVIVSGGTPNYTFNWSNGGQTPEIMNLLAGDYDVTVFDENGCSAEASTIITEPEPLLVQLEIEPITCNALSNGAITATITGGAAPYTAAWSNGEMGLTVNGLDQGNYNILVTDANNCTLSQSANLDEPEPFIIEASISEINCFEGTDGQIELIVLGGTPPYNYLWNNGNTTSTVNDLSAGTYNVQITDDEGCQEVVDYLLEEPTPVNFEVTTEDPVCHNEDNGVISITTDTNDATFSLDGITYQTWPAFNNLPAGNYPIYVQDINGCVFEATTTLNNPLPVEVVVMPEDTVLRLGQTITLQTVSTGGPNAIYQWSPAVDMDCMECPNPLVTPQQSIKYTVLVTDENGCTANAYSNIIVDERPAIFVPNAFSPNDDGINDYLTVYTNESVIQLKTLRIFSRWGEIIYEKTAFAPNDELAGWNGKLDGKDVGPGVYVYWVEAIMMNGQVEQVKGDVTLFR